MPSTVIERTVLLRLPIMTSTSKRRLALMGLAGLLAMLAIAWFAWGGNSYPTPSRAISAERQDAEKSQDDPRVIEANMTFVERARALEAGFKAAFLFHK